mgnify:CR=1 FL=1
MTTLKFRCSIGILIDSLGKVNCLVHLLTTLETVCGDNPTTSTIRVCFIQDEHKAIIRFLFSSEVVALRFI